MGCRSFVLFACSLLVAAEAAAQGLDQLAQPLEGRSRRASSAHRSGENGRYDPAAPVDPDSNWDNQNLAPGSRRVLLDAAGPGVVTHIWMTFLGPEPQAWAPQGSADHQEMVLRVWYDGREQPAVEVPVGDFFANAFGLRREVISVPVVVEDADSYNSFWRMPFRESARIEVENQSELPVSLLYYNVDWIELDELAPDTPYFHARYRQEYPVQGGRDYLILETEGRGHYVGTVLSVRTRSPSWFGEGDEKIYLDGEETPSIWGTGTEDYFLSAWGLKTVSTPYFGTPVFDQWGIVGGHTSAYRWHVQDPVVFRTGIRATIEHFGWISPDENPDYRSTSWNEREDDYSSVAFWYQTGEPTPGDPLPHARQRRLPSLDQVFHAVGVVDDGRHGQGDARVQQLLGYEAGQVLYQPDGAEDAWVELPFHVDTKRPARLLLKMTRSYDFGRYRASLDGVPLGGVLDFHREETDSWEYHLLDFWPDPGEHVLRLECVGKNPASTGHWLGIESVRLRERRPRVAEWAHDRAKDWRADPVLYR
jgi:hypothetical protein